MEEELHDVASAALMSAEPARYTRRLSDKVLIAFHQACDQGDYEVAERLMAVVGTKAARHWTGPSGTERRVRESLVAAHERLFALRHPVHIDDR